MNSKRAIRNHRINGSFPSNRVEEPRVVIVGGGFAGVQIAKRLKRVAVHVTLIDRNNFHLFQPLLYQVASGELSPADIATPLRYIFKRQRNISVLMDEVSSIDATTREVVTRTTRIPYDYLVLAAGANSSYFGNRDWANHSLALKSIPEALEIRKKLYGAFERAECASVGHDSGRSIRFVVVGGGPTGVELAGAIGELATTTLQNEFLHIDPGTTEILLLEAGNRLLPSFDVTLSERAQSDLERIGVQIRTRTCVTGMDESGVSVLNEDSDDYISADAVLWTAGIEASPLGAVLLESTGATLDKAGRVLVESDLSLPGYPNIFIAGDLACFVDESTQRPLPSIAPVAQQQGRYIGDRIAACLGGRLTQPFRYRGRGMLAVIGRAAAVADLGRIRLRGYPAWLIWLFVHIMQIVAFENRLLVFIQWAWLYMTKNRSARLVYSTNPESVSQYNESRH